MYNNTVVFIDGGYFFFYRFHATKLWFKKSHADLEIEDITEHEDFINMFKKKTESTINELSKKFKCKNSDIYFASDAARCNIWRNNLNIIEDYKGNRKPVNGIGKMIKIGYDVLNIMKNPPKIISCSNAEADDIIAIVSRKINSENPETNIKIISSDKDLEQLCNEKIVIHYLKNKFPVAVSKMEPKITLMMKIIGGDKSDNIPPICKKLGKKFILELATSQEALDKFLKSSSDETISNFNKNKTLIDLSLIPDEIKQIIIKKYEEINQISTDCNSV